MDGPEISRRCLFEGMRRELIDSSEWIEGFLGVRDEELGFGMNMDSCSVTLAVGRPAKLPDVVCLVFLFDLPDLLRRGFLYLYGLCMIVVRSVFLDRVQDSNRNLDSVR